jgi:hypothetical protein
VGFHRGAPRLWQCFHPAIQIKKRGGNPSFGTDLATAVQLLYTRRSSLDLYIQTYQDFATPRKLKESYCETEFGKEANNSGWSQTYNVSFYDILILWRLTPHLKRS